MGRPSIRNPGKVTGLYTAGFVAFIAAMAILEQLGVGARTIGMLFLSFTVAAYALIGFLSPTMQVEAWYVAGRQVPALQNGMATAADWISGIAFIALAGGIYFGGYSSLAYLIGWTGGYVLVNALMAPYLRRSGAYTVPDFIGTRYRSDMARLVAVVILMVVSFAYMTAQIDATGTIASRALGVPHHYGVWIGLAAILLCSLLGGMRAVTWTQVAQYIVLIVAYLLPVFFMSSAQGFGLLPQLSYGEALARIAGLEAEYGLHQAAEAIPGLSVLTTPHSEPSGGMEAWKFATLALCMMAGTASLPHMLMRFFTTPSSRSARKSAAWSLLFITLLYVTAPALATLTKLQLLDPALAGSIIGKPVAEVMSLSWVRNWSALDMVVVVDHNGDGLLQLNEFFMSPDIVVLATPEIAGLPYLISGLVAAGALAAAMATANGLLLAISNALSHDVYYRIVDRRADAAIRLLMARLLLLAAGFGAAFLASLQLTGILGTVAWAFSFACSGLFFPLVLGIWWKRANGPGALAGMIAGFAAGSAYLYHVRTGGAPVLGLDDLRFGMIGMAASLVAMVPVTLLTAPGDEPR